MIVRKVRKEDLEQLAYVGDIAFERGYTPKTWQERLQVWEERNDPRYPWQNHWGAFADDDKTLMGTLGTHDMRIRFDGSVVPMAGIGAVASLPEYRKMGTVRECFNKSFEEMRDKGQLFSQLYPFSTAYYHQYGYECSIPQSLYRFPISAIKKISVPGTVRAYKPGDDISDPVEIYERYSENVNHMAVRGEPEWKEFTDRFDTSSGMHYTFSYRDRDGRPTAYICMDKTVGEGGRGVLFAKEMIALTFEGFAALLQTVRGMSSKYCDIHIFTPDDFRAEHGFNEFTVSGFHWTRFRGMTRVIDVKKVLEIARYQGEGTVTLSILDAQCPWNQDTYRVEFRNGRAVSVARVTDAPDAEMSIGDFTALITGRYAEQDFDFIPELKIFKNRETLTRVFYKKRSYAMDLF